MKALFILFFLSLCTLNSQNNINPDIILEKTFSSKSLNNLSAYLMVPDTNNINLIYHGIRNSEDAMTNPGILNVDFNGNILHHYELSIGKSIGIKAMLCDSINRMYCSDFDGHSRSKIMSLFVNNSGNIISEYNDTILQRSYMGVLPVYHNDSIYQYDYYDTSKDSMYINVYDKYVNFSRKIDLNAESINEPIYYLPLLMNITKDNMLLVRLRSVDGDFNLINKFDMSGNLIWSLKIHEDGYTNIYLNSVIETEDDSYLVSALLYGEDTKAIAFIKIDTAGNLIWKKTYEIDSKISIKNHFEPLFGNQYFSYSGYYSDGYYDNHYFWLRIFNDMGEPLDSYTWSYDENSDNEIHSIISKDNGNILVYGSYGVNQLYLAEIKLLYQNVVQDKYHTNSNDLVSIIPNPADDVIKIKQINTNSCKLCCSIISSSGTTINSFHISPDEELSLSAASYPSGNYILKIEKIVNGSKLSTYTKKFIILH